MYWTGSLAKMDLGRCANFVCSLRSQVLRVALTVDYMARMVVATQAQSQCRESGRSLTWGLAEVARYQDGYYYATAVLKLVTGVLVRIHHRDAEIVFAVPQMGASRIYLAAKGYW